MGKLVFLNIDEEKMNIKDIKKLILRMDDGIYRARILLNKWNK